MSRVLIGTDRLLSVRATGTGAGTGTITLCLDPKSQKLAGGSRQLRSGTAIIHLLPPILENPVIVRIVLFFSVSSAAIHCIVSSTSPPSQRYANQSSLQAALSQSAICNLQRPGLGLIFGYSGKIQTPVPSAGHRLTLPHLLLGAQISIHLAGASVAPSPASFARRFDQRYPSFVASETRPLSGEAAPSLTRPARPCLAP